MRENIVRSTHKPLTAEQRREIEILASLPDETIDFSDIPELDEKFWANAVRNPFYKPVKKQLTVRLDADVIGWLPRKGKGYQTRLNSLLRGAMLKDKQSASHR
ncbi:MAG TPA: BrnA antitoxin family protein [Bryobacteraceae bacterium]|jgi:uncharacterized protein (DUF4415 family)